VKVPVSKDLFIINAAAFLRSFTFGLTGVVLGIYLFRAGLSSFNIGMVVAVGLVGSALATIGVTTKADRAGRRRALVALSLLGSIGALALAFTPGAVRDRVGRFQLADGGTLFLDEVAEIPLELQSKLLRVLQEGEFERVGEDRTRHVSVRVIAATNRDLEQEVEAGRFRHDLYFRLGVFPLKVPPLRDRLEDIPILAASFLAQAAKRIHCPVPVLTRSNVDDLTRYAWPGNIRELQNVIERAVILAGGGPLRFSLRESNDLATAGLKPTTSVSTRAQLLELERTSIVKALERSGGKIYGPGGAAEILGMRPTTLTSKIAVLQIKRR